MYNKPIQILSSLIILLAVTWTAYAATGTLDSPDTPANTQSYTLQDIYNRLDSGTAGAQSGFTEPSSGPTIGTMRTLNEIMGKAPTVDDTNGATSADILTGKTAWGLTSGEWGVIVGTGALEGTADLIKTGQTISYGEGDDGEYQKGFVLPNPRFTDNGDGTVTDNLTGLIWLKDAGCLSGNWLAALAAANTLASGSCSLSDGSVAGDWRLPNMYELMSVIDYGESSPPLPDSHPFINVGQAPYWTSTTFKFNITQAWYIDLNFGQMLNNGKSNSYGAWPVRGGP
ncbi:MAG: DUF1566 domain-containing protein [Chloroflexota bacterium]